MYLGFLINLVKIGFTFEISFNCSILTGFISQYCTFLYFSNILVNEASSLVLHEHNKCALSIFSILFKNPLNKSRLVRLSDIYSKPSM